MIIRITEAVDGPGFMYDVWMDSPEPEDLIYGDSDDGGYCTSPKMSQAIDMACSTAKDLLKPKSL